MTTWRKVACCFATVAGVLFTASAEIYRATAEGAGTKDGLSWENAMDWVTAVANCASSTEINEIWLAGDIPLKASASTIAFSGDTTVRGGFAGTESDPSERTGGHSLVSGAVATLFAANVAADAKLTFDRVDFEGATWRAFRKTGSGDIAFTDCSLSFNGRDIGHNASDVQGLGLYATGGGNATLTRCRIEGNGPTAYNQERPGGLGIRTESLSRLTLDGCTILTNGIWNYSRGGDLAPFRGSAMYLTATPLVMLNSRVSGSIDMTKTADNGGSVWLEGACGGTVISNTVFSGNLNPMGGYDYSGGGIVIFNLNSEDAAVDVRDCTFAYNVTQSRKAGCLAVYKGTVHVTGSTFFYNVLGNSAVAHVGSDISVLAAGHLDISNSHLTTLSSGSIYSVNPENLTIDEATITTGNPYFGSSVLDFEALLSYGASISASSANVAKLALLDVTPGKPPVKPDVGAGNVLYVDAAATGSGDGSSWENAFTDLGSALAVASSVKNEIWVKNDLAPAADPVWTAIDSDLVVRGGFAGTEETAADRAAGAATKVDGADTRDFVKVSVGPGAALTFDGFVFMRAKSRAIEKRGLGDLKCVNCRFLNNGTQTTGVNGRGIQALGGSTTAKLTLDACEFAGQRYKTRGSTTGSGSAVFVAGHERFICDDSLFCSNGVPILNGGNDNRAVKGSTLLIQGTPVTMRNTRIAANGGSSRESGTGGIVLINGYADGSAFTNCAFVGNHANNFKDGQTCDSCGALVYSPAAASHRLEIENCTFAYNLSQGNYSPGGLNVLTGTVKIHNSIFWHNIHGYKAQSGYGADIDVKSAGAVTVSHSIVTGKTAEFCHGAASNNLVLDDDTVFTVDPSFVSSYEDYASHLNFNGTTYIDPGTGYGFAYLGSLDVHLLSAEGYWLNDGSVGPATSVTSLAIDAGDKNSPYGTEPTPNGGRINLGAYGNTEFASKTPSGQPSVESFEITYPDGYSRPQAELTLGLESGTSYKATVTFTCKTGDVVVATGTFEGCQSGNVVTWKPPYYFQPGTPLVIEYAVSAPGATTKAGSGDSTATGRLPDFYGKGGGPNVIHVREGADCLMNGTSWTDAYPDVPAALQDIGPGKTEIWIAKTNTFASGVFTLEAPLAIRGGFAGMENSPAERTGANPIVFDMQGASAGFQFTAGADCPLVFDRVVVKRASDRAITKSGAGPLVLVDCQFLDNGRSAVIDGRGMHVSGGILAVTNCVFDGNYYESDADTTGSGGGAYITGCTCATFEGCVFVQNGNRFIPPNYQKTGGSSGGAIYANATRLVCRNTRFAANCIGKGAIVHLNGNCNGSLFEHCAFVGNQMLQHWLGSVGTVCAPLVVAMDAVSRTAEIRNCTFAYNIDTNRSAPGGLLITSGKVVIEDSIFWGNVRSSYVQPETSWPSAEDIEVRGSSTLAMTNVCIRSTSTDTSGPHCLQFANPANVTMCNILTVDPMLVSTSAEIRALTTDPDGYAYYASSVIPQLRGINVHLRGGSGYHDENDNGALVRTYSRGKVGGSSPAIDTGTKMLKGLLEPYPNGCRVNLGAYGNTPWATMSDTGFLLFVR